MLCGNAPDFALPSQGKINSTVNALPAQKLGTYQFTATLDLMFLQHRMLKIMYSELLSSTDW
jgi:hypothetical protein